MSLLMYKQYVCIFNGSKAVKFRSLFTFGLIIFILIFLFKLLWISIFNREDNDSFLLEGLNETGGSDSESDVKPTAQEVKISEIYPNCGIRHQCPEQSFPVHIYTGQDKDDQPKLCVNGKYVSGVGRGLNIAIIESSRLQLVSLANFDLYSHNSLSLELWLENEVHDYDIIIAFTFDEASKELSQKAKAILYGLGSGKIQDLQFRSQWYMISQKGITGFTPLENITYAKNDQWGEVLNEKFCVPNKILPTAVSPNPLLRKNPLRVKLCSESTELKCEEFCSPLARYEPIIPSLLTNRSLIGNVVFSTPVLVVAGESLSSLALTLETLVYQPGIHSASVVVVHPERLADVPHLSKIFGFQTFSINSSTPLKNNDVIGYGLQYLCRHFPKKRYAIVLEEGLVLSPDFLFYMAQMAPILDKDESLTSVSAWNPYGYEGVSGDVHAAYRVENFPGLGFMIPLETFRRRMEGKMSHCCSEKTWGGWEPVTKANEGKHSVIPDVSRVLRRPKDLYERGKSDDEFRVFTKRRVTNTDHTAWIERPHDLVQHRYFQRVADLVQSSITFYLSEEDLRLCEEGRDIALTAMLHELTGKVFSVYYREKSCRSTQQVRAHLKCFRIYLPPDMRVQNMYEKVLRFTVNTNTVLLIDSTSAFAKNKSRPLHVT